MKDENKQAYIDMHPRVFVRALRDPHGADLEYELSEGEATDLLQRREQVYVDAIAALLPILHAVRFSVGLGKTQLARIEAAAALLSKHAVTGDPREAREMKRQMREHDL